MEMSLKNMLLAGIGTVAHTYEKGIGMIDDMVKKGEITVNQGKELNDELKRKFNDHKEKVESGDSITVEKMKEILSGLNLATKQDIDQMNDRINKLEKK